MLDDYPAHQARQEDRHEALEDAPAQFLDVVEEGHFAPVLTSLRHAAPPQTPAPDAGEATAPGAGACRARGWPLERGRSWRDRKSTRLNSSHQIISYAVLCL